VTEVPEHLLKRAQAAREKAAGGSGEAAPAEASSSAAVEPAGGGGGAVVTPASGPAPAVPAPEPAYTGPPQAPPRRQRVPAWAMPVIVALPLWAVLYGGAFGERKVAAVGKVAQGQTIYATAGCSGCHGPTGAGSGQFPSLHNVTKTFPTFAEHVAWVETGSAPFKGQTYGNSGRVATGGMPAFKGPLTPEEIVAVVCHERVDYGNQNPIPPECLDTVAGAPGEGASGG
jgi:mono/diheme cytochrome c family protein